MACEYWKTANDGAIMSIEMKNVSLALVGFSLEELNLRIQPGEFFVILGPSGAGKTLILELLAGLILPDMGAISGVDRERLGFIYQDYMLFPHLNVMENIGYGLRIRKRPKGEIRQKTRDLAVQLGIGHLLERGVENLSGGEKQRVAIARAMAIEPQVFLVDEPTAALDRNTRALTQQMFMDLHKQSDATFVHVTHDFEEALALADRIAVILDGRIQQVGTPDQVFNQPASRQIADFLGYKNVFCGPVEDYKIRIDGVTLGVPLEQGDNVYLAIRSDDIFLSRQPIESSARNTLQGTVTNVMKRSAMAEVVLDAGIVLTVDVTRKSCEEMGVGVGDTLFATFKVSSLRVFRH